jgi:putative photosynthetic complex assembly protein
MANNPVFPRLPLFAVFAALTITVVGAFVGRVTHASVTLPGTSLVAERDLRFLDRADGAVIVQSAQDGHEVAVYTGEQGFLRGTLRGFARTRHLSGLGSEQPFQLSRWSDGRLTIDDKATGQHVELMAFGPTNVAVFAPLLDRN